MVFLNTHGHKRRVTKRHALSYRALAPEALEARNLLSAADVAPLQAGSWTTLTNNIPDPGGAQLMMLLSDGTVMAHGGGGSASKLWYQLTPDSNGSYVNGTWSPLQSMGLERLFFASNVLPSGKVFLVGGEYSGPATDQNFNNTGEIYDPVTNIWTSIASFPKPEFGDGPTSMLPDGRVLAGYLAGPQTYIYDPATNNWTQTGAKLRNDRSDEESWVKLPDDSILSYDVFSSIQTGVPRAQRYIPSQGTWVDAGTLPFQLSTQDAGFELGPAFLLPDGRALFFGANGNTAYYTPSTNSWTAGPAVPNGLGCDDDPGAMLPNGNVLITASPINSQANPFPGPTTIFELDPVTNTYLDVTPTNFDVSQNAFTDNMLVLPSGQILMSNYSRQLAVYTPVGFPQNAWRPTISNVTHNGNIFTLTGTQLNGISEGAAYGDDNEMSTNYPIIRLRDLAGNGFFVRTFNWSSTGVATGNTPVTVQFQLPAGRLPGTYGVTVIANGIPSVEVLEDLGGIQITDVTQLEGNAGLTNFVFTVAQPPRPNLVTADFSTADGSAATADNDYIAKSGTLIFAPGETVKQITIQVVGDTKVEADETFFLKLFNIQGANDAPLQGIGTILNDDLGVSINDITVIEGNSGTKDAVFTISTIGVSHAPATVGFVTVDGTAHGGSDYVPVGGAFTFAAGSTTSRTITVPIIGDVFNESTEEFFVALSNLSGASIVKGIGVCTIIDNDPMPALYVNDVQVTTTDLGTLAAVFTVALDTPSGQDVTVQYATADGTAHAFVDYEPQSGTLTFGPGVRTQFVTVPISGSATYAPNEKFFLNLFNAQHALIADAQGVGTLVVADPSAVEIILDDGDPGFATTAGWVNGTNLTAYQLDFDSHAAGNGSGFATWTFNNLATATYQIFARWVPFSNRASNAPYTMLDGSTSLGTVTVDQRVAPAGDLANGITWQSLGLFHDASGKLVVRLNDNANGYVIADAIRIVAGGIAAQHPEMDVAMGDVSIGTGDTEPTVEDGTDFGSVPTLSDSVTHTFTITNTGNAALHLPGSPRVAVTGAAAGDFTVVQQPDFTVAAGHASTFQVTFDPTDAGLRQATISIDNDDDSEHPYTFAVQGTGFLFGTPDTLGHNPVLPLDVNADSLISSLDALIIINRLNSTGTSSVASPSAAPQKSGFSAVPTAAVAAAPASAEPNYYVDVNGDGIVSPRDALMVINYLIGLGNQATPSGIIAGPAASPLVASVAPAANSTSPASDALQAIAVDQAISEMTASDVPGQPAKKKK